METYKSPLEQAESMSEGKTLKFSPDEINAMIQEYAPYYKGLHIERIPVQKLVEDNELMNDAMLESYHQEAWKNAKAKDFHIDESQIASTRRSGIPFAVKRKDGKITLSDGKHRTRAAYNDGYNFVEYPLYSEEE